MHSPALRSLSTRGFALAVLGRHWLPQLRVTPLVTQGLRRLGGTFCARGFTPRASYPVPSQPDVDTPVITS